VLGPGALLEVADGELDGGVVAVVATPAVRDRSRTVRSPRIELAGERAEPFPFSSWSTAASPCAGLQPGRQSGPRVGSSAGFVGELVEAP